MPEGGAVVDPERFGNVARCFNHACKPTLLRAAVEWSGQESGPLMFLYAARNIEPGEQCTWDYGGGRRGRGFSCKCDSCAPAGAAQRRRGGAGAGAA